MRMSRSNINSVISVIPVKDYDNAMIWYTTLLEREADIVPVEYVAEWQLTENAWVQVTKDPDRAGKSTVIIGVQDIEDQRTMLEKAKMPIGEIIEIPGIIKMAEIVDPDGNKISFVQDISESA
jgi:predicted enzyme related to lactoylglutathione lyase